MSVTVILADGSTDQYSDQAPPGPPVGVGTATGSPRPGTSLSTSATHAPGTTITPKPSKPSTHPPAGSRSPDSNAPKNPRIGSVLTSEDRRRPPNALVDGIRSPVSIGGV